jgi:hypothetical protein
MDNAARVPESETAVEEMYNVVRDVHRDSNAVAV